MEHDQVDRSSHQTRPRAFRIFSAFVFITLFMFGAIGACAPEVVGTCIAGYINADGVCEGKCDPSKCVAGNTCVNNRCVLVCDSQSDCFDDGTQICAPAIEDKTNAAINTCQPSGSSYGVGFSCPFGNECANAISCRTTGEKCDLAQCDGQPDTCQIDTEACYARANCNIGKCPDGKPCMFFSCALQDCTAELVCASNGVGDTEAYCTKNDCNDDADCPGGFYCGLTHDPHELCNSSPTKGNNDFCGRVPANTPCIDPGSLGQGNTMVEGQLCILRKACIRRKDCDPCTTDLDCADVANHCVTMPKESQKRCARECLTSSDCGDEYACVALDPNDMNSTLVCKHKFGACIGSGKFCDPCRNDADCGPVTGTSACYEYDGGQRGCSTPCETNADCPLSPSNIAGVCYLDDPTGPLYKHCILEGTSRCW